MTNRRCFDRWRGGWSDADDSPPAGDAMMYTRRSLLAVDPRVDQEKFCNAGSNPRHSATQLDWSEAYRGRDFQC